MIRLLKFGDSGMNFALEWMPQSSGRTSEEASTLLGRQLSYTHVPNSMLENMLYSFDFGRLK